MTKSINAEIENLVDLCDKVKKDLKSVAEVIIFKDLKKKIKTAYFEVDTIKKRIAHNKYAKEIKIMDTSSIDSEDRAFITENYMEVKNNDLNFDHLLSKQFTLSENDDTKYNFPFSSYGTAELESVLSTIGKNWNFDIWFIYNSTGNSIFICAKYLLKKWGLNEAFKISDEATDLYFKTLEKSYNKNPYHNACHAADVLHTLLFFYYQSKLHAHLGAIDILSSIIAALGHDVSHPAVTNRFLVNNQHELAFEYNDNSVLENMHCSKTFLIMQRPGCNIFENLVLADYFKARKLIIEMILETDMSKHFEILGRFRTRALNLSDIDLENTSDKILVLSMALKCADIGHSAKNKDLHEKWTNLVCQEFFNQGDLEKAKKQTISMYCDRETTNIPKSQSGFIKNICLPLFKS